jgi:acyl-CoA reductase-like NAD-dependent aldehyde dehydrogenase
MATPVRRTRRSRPRRTRSWRGRGQVFNYGMTSLKRVGDEILARSDELGRLLSREEGKPLAEGVGEVVRAGQIFLFFSGECLRLAGDKISSVRPGVDVEVMRDPIGVVGLITPWNFSISIPA